MPIRPENVSRYPKNWNAIRTAILIRSGLRCEICGAYNGSPHPVTGAKVVLTIMHMDHTPENCAGSNLKAACQKCHNSYDAEHRKHTRRMTMLYGEDYQPEIEVTIREVEG